MTNTPPLRSLSLFLLDRRIECWEEALRSTSGLHEHRLKPDSRVDGVLYLRPQGRTAPNWVGFVEPHVEDEGSLRGLFNASTSAVLFLIAGSRRFAVVFGQGRHLLDPDCFEYDFGLRVVLNAVEPERLKSIDAKRFDERTMHTRRDSSREASFSEFGLCVRMLETYEGEEYKKTFGAAIDQLRPLRSAAQIQLLDEQLLDDLRNRRLDTMHLAPPEITDWMDHDGFLLSTDRSTEHPEPDPSISTYLDSLRDPANLNLAKLKRDHVEAVDAASGIARRRWPVYACLVYDTRLDGELFVLSGKQWFRVSESFDQEITEFVEALPEADLPLPDAPRKVVEDDYNVLAAQAIGALCTHPQLVHVPGRDPVELCDILTSDRRFVHVKRRGASSTLSHLFAQGLLSAELYLDDQRFRDGAADLLDRLGASPALLSKKRPNPGEWEVAYVVLTRGRRKDTPYTLPFFSLANLASSARRLQDRGFKVSVAEVREV